MKKSEKSTAVVPVVVTPTVETFDDYATRTLNAAYHDIYATTRTLIEKVLAFGCVFAEVEQKLQERGLVSRRDGEGLSAWLAKHCPAINYKTAMRWKQFGVKASQSLECNPGEAYAILSGDCKPSRAQKSRVKEMMAVESVRELSQLLFDYASEAKGEAGRPAGSKNANEKITRVEAARRLWASLVTGVARQREGLYKSAALLPIDEARASLAEMRALVDALVKRCKEEK